MQSIEEFNQVRNKLMFDLYEYIKTHPMAYERDIRNAVWGKPGLIDIHALYDLQELGYIKRIGATKDCIMIRWNLA